MTETAALLPEDKLGRKMPGEGEYTFPPVTGLRFDPVPLSEMLDWSLRFIQIETAWIRSQGEGEIVAVLDTGCDLSHPDLQGAILDAQDFTGSRFGPNDRQSHGTWCAGFIGARAGNGIGVKGIAPKVKLLIGKVLDDRGFGSDESIRRGVAWAIQRGATVISMSLGGRGMSRELRAVIAEAEARNITVVVAAGNDGRSNSVNDPARWPETIAVSAVDENGRLTSFSSYGPQIDVAAPGQDMLSTVPGGLYARMSGTSMACPLVAGVIALYRAARRLSGRPAPTLQDVRKALLDTCIDAGAPGKDSEYGFGLINPSGLVNSIPQQSPSQPTQPSDPQSPTGSAWGDLWRAVRRLLRDFLKKQ